MSKIMLIAMIVLGGGMEASAQTARQRQLARYRAYNAAHSGSYYQGSWADRADAIEAALGLHTETVAGIKPFTGYSASFPNFVASKDGPAGLGLGQGRPNMTTAQSMRINRGSGYTTLADPRNYVRPIHHTASYPPHGPIRWLEGPNGAVPDYIIPYSKRGNYKFLTID